MPGPVPADFASFVENHEGRLRAACHDLIGHGQLGDLLAVDLLASVAVRWRLRPAHRRQRAGANRLDRLLRREIKARNRPAERAAERATERASERVTAAVPQIRPPGESTGGGGTGRAIGGYGHAVRRRKKQAGGIRVLVDVPVSASPFAERAWARARAIRRTRILTSIGFVALLACVLVVGPPPPLLLPQPDPGPIMVPDGVRVLPRFADLAGLARRSTPLPVNVDVTPASTVDLLASPVRRAIAVLRAGTGPLLVLSDDGPVRTVNESRLADSQLLATSLSPDGARVALATATGLLVVDLNSGVVKPIAAPATLSELIWRGARVALLPAGADTLEVDVDTGTVTRLTGVRGADLVSARGPADLRLVELVPKSASVTLPPRIRAWHGAEFEDRPIFAPAWIGAWTGAGWSTLDLMVRQCSAGEIALPGGRAQSAVGAVNANGLYEATLVTADETSLDILGFADTGTVLVGAYSPIATDILAWSPGGTSVQLVATVNGNVRLSVADLLAAGS